MTAPEILIEDREFWNQFIDLYRNLPELWSKPRDQNRGSVLRDRAHAILLRKYRDIDPSVTVDSIKAVLKQLRSVYRAEFRKKLQYTRNSTTGSTIPCSPSPWYVDALSFLKSPNSERPNGSNAHSVTAHSHQITTDGVREDLRHYCKSLTIEFQKLSDTQLQYAQAHVERILRGAQLEALSSDWPKTDPSIEEVSCPTPEAWFDSATTINVTGRGGKRGPSREENSVRKCNKLNEGQTEYIENVTESEGRPSTKDDASFEVKYEIYEDVLMEDDTNDSEGQQFDQHEQQQQAVIKYEYTDYDERDVVSENDQEQDSMNDYDEQHENASVTFPLELKEHDTLHERNGGFSNTTENVETSTVDTNQTPKAKGQMQSTARKASHEATMSNTKHFMIVRLPSGTALRRQCTAHKSSYIDNVVVNYSETDFLENFRIGRKTVHKICQHLAKMGCFQQAKGHGGYAAIGVETNVLAFLWFLGQEKAHYRDVAERFDLSLSCLHDVIWRMCDALLLLKPTVFVRPNENRKQMLVDHFAKLCAIPGVIGIVDGTHIRIDKPSENPNTYLVQKRYYSLQLQAIFDENKQFIDVFVDYPGEPDLLTAVRELCTDQYCILGSDAYPCIPQLLVPYRAVAEPLTEGQVMFNAQLASVQKVYENTFTMVKQRFRQLYHLKSRQLSNVVKLIKVCCILHNLAPQEEMALLGRDNTQQKMPFSDAGFVFTYASESEAKLELGKQKREQICAYLQVDTSR